MIRANIRHWFHLALRRRDRWEREVEDEIKLHLALRAEQLMAEGATPDDAYREAVRRFGPLTASRARLLDAARHREQRMHRTEYLSDLRQDISFALRTLARERTWTAVTIATLALGVGATTAVFSVVSTLLLHPLPYPDAGRIVYVHEEPSEGNNTGISVTITPAAQHVRAWMQGAHSFEALEGYHFEPRAMKTTSEPSTVMTASVFPTFPAFAGHRPLVGRMFTKHDIEQGSAVVLLGESIWRERFGGTPQVLGQLITLGDSSFQIIGVMPAALQVPGAATLRGADMWLPLDVRNNKLGMQLIGRLRRSATIPVAMSELDSIFARTSGFTNGKRIPFKTVITSPARAVRFHDSLVMLSAAVALVLLIACANVAHLLLARAATRQRELAIRAALGAGRGRLLRQLLAENVILSGAGTACGLFVGWAGLRGLVALRPQSLDSLQVAHLDATTLGVALAVAVISGVVFALIGAVQSARSSTHDALRSGAPSGAGLRPRGRTRGMLVVSEMALSATLLVGATLLVRSVTNLQSADLGFQPSGLYSFGVPLMDAAFDSPEARGAAIAAFTARVRALPGVQSVAAALVEPGTRWFGIGRLQVQGEAVPPKSSSSFVDVNKVQPTYFATMGISFRQGATFSDTTLGANPVIINAGFARKHWGDRSAVGQRIRIAQTDSEPWLTVVGVVRDAQTSGPVSESSAPVLYTPLTQMSGFPKVLVRTTGTAASLAPGIGMLKQLGVKKPTPPQRVSDTIVLSIAAPRFVMLLLAIFTGLALLLSSVGLYGVMAYSVTQRTREIGIRVALGASEQRIARGVIGRGAALAFTGATIGLVAAIWGTKLIESQLRGVTRLDPTSFAIGAVVLIAAALVACIVPTRRALRVDPMTAIRAD